MKVLTGLSVVAATLTGLLSTAGSSVTAADAASPTPIKHVVVFFQENHSFNNLLGAWCVQTQRCVGTMTGRLSNGRTIRLGAAPDIVAKVGHTVQSQTKAIDGGKMDGFDHIPGCAQPPHPCYSTFLPTLPSGKANTSVENVINLAQTFAVSDMTFEPGPYQSWGEHLSLATGTEDGFSGNNPAALEEQGWGCDSGYKTGWSKKAIAHPGAKGVDWQGVPTCIPAVKGSGAATMEPKAVQKSPVPWVPTIMDDLAAAGRSWKIYAAPKGDINYSWAVCPTFADCLYTNEAKHMEATENILKDANAGHLPSFSLLLPHTGPSGSTSQHNQDSMTLGDNWIGKVIGAIEKSKEWSSTAILLTWDDCGCFYDPVEPAKTTYGIRVPMILISPWAIPHHTDSHAATFSSILAFTESALGLPPLGPDSSDRTAYNYLGSFNFNQTPAQVAANRLEMLSAPVPASSWAYIKANPPNQSDPT